ncbi:MAG: acetyl-CoA acetyltransferase [Firmicutes bacterium ZCTH02-B6]|nr:MAG: acetyl-CoA acetyltransferase [Firmicutes bacterium ZCTH02-B6]
MPSTVILAGARTPFGVLGGALKDVPAPQLGAAAIRAALSRAQVPGDQVDNVIMGMVVQAGAGQIPARQASLGAGLPVTVTSETINKVCASGMRAVNWGDVLIRAGEADVVVAGGMENMSRGPYLLPGARFGHRLGHGQMLDATVFDGLWCAFENVHMGHHGERMAREFGVSREEQDAWAYRSHVRAISAIDSGRMALEITPVEVPDGRGGVRAFDTDEAPRRDTSPEKLARLRPAFAPDGCITAGNAPGINDGAAALVLMSEARARAEGRRPLARIRSFATVSAEPPYLATVPHLAAEKALAKAGLNREDIGLVEINEAFAVVTLVSTRLGQWTPEIVNVNGGAIALGHPVGASGARIVLTLALEMQRRGVQFGLASICSGGGQGEAIVLELVEA